MKNLLMDIGIISRENKVISLYEKVFDWNEFLKFARILFQLLICIIVFVSFTNNNVVIILLIWIISTVLLIQSFSMNKRILTRIKEKNSIRFALLSLILDNNLYTETRGSIELSAIFSYELLDSGNGIIVHAQMRGNLLDKKITALETELQALFSLPLENKQIFPDECVYVLKEPDKRLVVSNEAVLAEGTTMFISESLSVDIAKVAHGLTVGGTGSGKSFFINAKILAYTQMSGKILGNEKNWEGADIRIADPKASDLSLYRFVTGFEGKVAVESNEIARMVREASELVESRYREMFTDISAFGKTFIDFPGVRPVVIFIDEYAALVKTLDKKTKDEITKYLYNIVLKGRACGVFAEIILQRPDASVLDGAIRDQLGTRVGLSNLSSDGRTMLFGKCDIDFKTVTVKGGGYVNIESVTENPVYFETPLLLKDFDFLGEIEKINSERLSKTQ